MNIKLKSLTLFLVCSFFLCAAAYFSFSLYFKNAEKRKNAMIAVKGEMLSEAFKAYRQAGLDLIREVARSEGIANVLLTKNPAQKVQVQFFLDSIKEKSTLPDVQISILDPAGLPLWGNSENVDPSVLILGLQGEERLFGRLGSSFFHRFYLEGISPILKEGKIAGLVHVIIPLEKPFLLKLQEKVKEELFLFVKGRFEDSTLFAQESEQNRKTFLELLRHPVVEAQIKEAHLKLSADRKKENHRNISQYASLSVLPLRGMGQEVVALLMAVIPEQGLANYQLEINRFLLGGLGFLAVFLFMELIIFMALRLTKLSSRVVWFIFAATFSLLCLVWISSKGLQMYLWKKLEQNNRQVVLQVDQAFRDYKTYLYESIGDERKYLKEGFIHFLQGEQIEKPSLYEFAYIPLGLRADSITRVTDSHVPIKWSDIGIFSEKAEDPFAREKGIYKVPVGRYAQKLWLTYSSAWGYPNKFGSPYGTTIGSVKIFFEEGHSVEIELKNGINIHDRFSPLQKSADQEVESKKAFEFISAKDPLTRLQYVEELEFTIPPLYTKSKIDYILFEDKSTPDVPIFYSVTLGRKKVPAQPVALAVIAETEKYIQLKEAVLPYFENMAFIYYEGEHLKQTNLPEASRFSLQGTQAPEAVIQEVLNKGNVFTERTSFFDKEAVLSYWPIKEKEFEKPWGMVAVFSAATHIQNFQHILGFIHMGLFVFLMIIGVVGVGNFIISWRKLRFKLITYSFLVSFVPLILIVLLVGYLMWSKEESAIRSQVSASVEQSNVFLRDIKTRVEDIALHLFHNEEFLIAVKKRDSQKIQNFINESKKVGLVDLPNGFILIKVTQGIFQAQQWYTPNYPALPYAYKNLTNTIRSGLFVNQVASVIAGVCHIALSDPQEKVEEGRLTITVGAPVDQSFLKDMKRSVGSDLAFFSLDALKWTTLSVLGEEKALLNLLAKKKFSSLLRKGKTQFGSFLTQENGKMAIGFFPLKDDSNKLIGMIAAFKPYKSLWFLTFSTQKIFIAFTLFILALAGLMSIIVSRSITYPIAVLAHRADQMSQGDLESTIQVATKDEIGELAQSFNHMSQSLKENQDHLEHKIKDLETLQKISTQISSVLEKEELIQLIVKLFCELTRFPKGLLFSRELKAGQWEIRGSFGWQKNKFPACAKQLARLVSQENKIIFIANHLQDKRVYLDQGMSQEAKAYLGLPLIVKDKERGILILEHPSETMPAEKVDEILLMTLANHAAVALENAYHYEMAIEDGLTKVFVKRYFQFRLLEEIDHAKRYHSDLSLVLIDLDSFKPVNDTYGHQMGDKILIAVARVMKELFRSTDVVSRYGGDEFVVILPKTNNEDAYRIAERLRQEVQSLDFEVDPNIILKVTLSLGVASWKSAFLEPEDLIEAADQALYESKTRGRNRVSRFEQSA